MGNRSRNGERAAKKIARAAVSASKKHTHFSRAKALKALTRGEDPTATRFTSHSNYHVRQAAWKKSGSNLPDDPQEQATFLLSLQSKTKQQKKAG